MFGLLSRRKNEQEKTSQQNVDVARLFFDSFSKRVSSVEADLKAMSSEVERLKISLDRGQISDLVLLERLQKAEGVVREALTLARQAFEVSRDVKEISRASGTLLVPPNEGPLSSVRREVGEEALSRRVLTPTGELGSLPSITTPTELQVLTMLANEGPKSAPEIGLAVGRSREHTARLMKKLYEEGYIRRDQARIPFRYSLVDRVKQSFVKREAKDGGREEISVPQT
jgi:CRP-like cAMP-binding protein